jgi:quinol monooxygenase YgiN
MDTPIKPELIVTARYRVKPERRVEFMAAAHALAEESQAAGGCCEFRVMFDANDPGFFVLYQTWAALDSMMRHFQCEPMLHFQETLERLKVDEPEIIRYRIAA